MTCPGLGMQVTLGIEGNQTKFSVLCQICMEGSWGKNCSKVGAEALLGNERWGAEWEFGPGRGGVPMGIPLPAESDSRSAASRRGAPKGLMAARLSWNIQPFPSRAPPAGSSVPLRFPADGQTDGGRTTIPGREGSKPPGCAGTGSPGPGVGGPRCHSWLGRGDPEGMCRLGEEPACSPTLLLYTLKEQWLCPSELPSGAAQPGLWAF